MLCLLNYNKTQLRNKIINKTTPATSFLVVVQMTEVRFSFLLDDCAVNHVTAQTAILKRINVER